MPAAVLLPAVLAGVALAWPGQRVAAGLDAQASAALAAVGLGDVAVHVSGRDAALAAVPAGSEEAAATAVGGVVGVRAVSIVPGTGVGPLRPEVGPLPSDRRALAEELTHVVGQAPVTFAADSAELAGPPAATVARVGALLAARPDIDVQLAGFAADTPGPAEVAVALSEQRARVVAAALAAAGVDPARISVQGLGATRPLSSTAASRRVEISIR